MEQNKTLPTCFSNTQVRHCVVQQYCHCSRNDKLLNTFCLNCIITEVSRIILYFYTKKTVNKNVKFVLEMYCLVLAKENFTCKIAIGQHILKMWWVATLYNDYIKIMCHLQCFQAMAALQKSATLQSAAGTTAASTLLKASGKWVVQNLDGWCFILSEVSNQTT